MKRWTIMSVRPPKYAEATPMIAPSVQPISDDEEADRERRLRAVDDARKHVAAEVVGAEQMLARRRREDAAVVDRQRVVRRDPLGERGRDEHQHDDGEPGGAERLLHGERSTGWRRRGTL